MSLSRRVVLNPSRWMMKLSLSLSLSLSFFYITRNIKACVEKEREKRKTGSPACVCAAGREGTADHHHATDYKISAQQPLRRTEYCGVGS